MKHVGKATYLFLLIFATSIILLISSSSSEKAALLINTEICQRIRLVLSSITSLLPFSVFEILVFLSPFLVLFALRYIARGEADVKRRFVRVLSFLSVFVSLYILTLGISYNTPSHFSEYASPVSKDDLIFAATVLRDAVNVESEIMTDEPSFESMRVDASRAFSVAAEKIGLKAGNISRPKPLISSKLVSYTGALAIYSFPTGEINVNVDAPTYTLPFTLLHELGHSCGAASETDANFIAYLAALESDSHFLRYSVSLSLLEYMLSDLKGVDLEAYLKCFEGLSEIAKEDMNLWHKYSKKYHSSLIFRIFDLSNTHHLERWDNNGSAAYSAVSVYVTNYLCYA